MFRFKALELMNWDCYAHYRVPLDGDIILLVGQNGSGKTTFLDALRVLLNAPRLSKSRNLHHYIQEDVEIALIKAVVTNQLVGGKRPFSHLGIYGDGDVSLLCVLHNQGPQKIEKEYFIIKGDVGTEEIGKLKNGLKPLQYSRYLEEAGVSRSTLKLIALEQGQTDRIGQLSARELLDLVMDITGNREIIKKYEEAKQNYQKSFQQLVELRTEYNKICLNTQELEKKAREASLFREMNNEKQKIELEKLPLSRWYNLLNQIHTLEQSCKDLNDKRVILEKQNSISIQQQEELNAKKDEFERTQTRLKEMLVEQDRKLNQIHQQIGQCHSQWQRLDELRKACTAISKELVYETAMARLEDIQSHYYQQKGELEQLQKSLEAKKKERTSLKKQSLPSYPPEVAQFREILRDASITHSLLAECLEIVAPEWQLAIEAFLARDRFCLFVGERDFLKAKKFGEKNRYSFYISEYCPARLPAIREHSILSYLKVLDERVNTRLVPLNDVILVDSVEEGHKYKGDITITRQGYRQDRRGGIFIANSIKFYCGGLAVERQMEEAEQEIESLVKQIDQVQQTFFTTAQEMREAENQLVLLKKKDEWEKAQQEYNQLKQQGDELLKASEGLVEERKRISGELDRLIEERNRSIQTNQELHRELEKLQREKQQLGDALRVKEQQLVQLLAQKGNLEKQLPAKTSQPYTPEQLEPPEWLERKLQDMQRQVDNYNGCRDFAYITLYEHEAAELGAKQKQLRRQEEDHNQRSGELDKCRDDYRQMIMHTINFYNKAVKELAELAGCQMRVSLELGSGESLIEDATLCVRVSFDQKTEVDIHDKSLSGGQDVIASLILLVALSRMEQEGSGFFFMDEPNAHLDMLRIMEVGHFLRSTRAQFVLTTPTTENVASLAMADLVLTFTKRAPQEKWAPKPRYIRRA